MEQLIVKILEQAPSAGAVIIVVIIFVRFISKRDDLWVELHKEHLEARRVSSEALKANTEALAKNTAAFVQMTERLESIDYFCPVAQQHGGLQVPKHKIHVHRETP